MCLVQNLVLSKCSVNVCKHSKKEEMTLELIGIPDLGLKSLLVYYSENLIF